LITPDWYSAATYVGAPASARSAAATSDLLLIAGGDTERLRRYAGRHGKPWFVISAEHGLMRPDEWPAPSDRYLPDTPRWYREAWGAWVAARLRLLAGDLSGRTVEVNASPPYAAAVTPWLVAAGAVVRVPPRLIRPPPGGSRGGP
jgi:hypothetical protein